MIKRIIFILITLPLLFSLVKADKINLVKLKKKEEKRRSNIKKKSIKLNNKNLLKNKSSKKKGKNKKKTSLTYEEELLRDTESQKENRKKEEAIKKGIVSEIKRTREEIKKTKKDIEDTKLTNNKLFNDQLQTDDYIKKKQLEDDLNMGKNRLKSLQAKLERLKKKEEELMDKARRNSVEPGLLR